MCTHGDLYLYECPDGLWWDPNTSECEYPGDFCFDGTTPSKFEVIWYKEVLMGGFSNKSYYSVGGV